MVLKVSRSSKDPSVVLSSVKVVAQRLDEEGKAAADEVVLGTLRVGTESGTVSIEFPDGTVQEAPGYQISIRERGRDTRTTIMKLFGSPEPEPEQPPPSAWPDASNTGHRGALVKTAGRTIRSSTTVIEGEHITGTLTIDAANVVVRNCRIDAGFFGIEATSSARGLIVEDCTIVGGGDSGVASTRAADVIIRRNNVYGGFDGMKIAGTNVIVERNFIHDLASGPEAHNDGIQVYGSGVNLQFIGNAIYARDTSCIAMFPGKGFKYNEVLVKGNLLTGAGYLLYAGGQDGTGIRVLGNTFGDWGWGPVSDYWESRTGNEWSGNVTRSGQPLLAV